MLGMYVHMHWSYNHPYAARTWTLDDWRSYLTGLRSLGYDFLMVWPMLDSMSPEPNASDLTFLRKLGDVIHYAHDLDMRVGLVACPNTIGAPEAANYGFEERPYFNNERRLDPRDSAAIEQLLTGRRQQFAPVNHADALVMIDSDPGGFVGSTNAEFADLVLAQSNAFRQGNPDAELIYWMHFGWENYGRFWDAVNRWQPGDPGINVEPNPEVFLDTLRIVAERIPEPWSILSNRYFPGHAPAIEALGLTHKSCGFQYGLIEGEPSFPFSNCDPALIARTMAGYTPESCPRGFMANCQTHALQLPHTYLVAEHWTRGPAAGPDLAIFGESVIPGLGSGLERAWLALESGDAPRLRACAAEVRESVGAPHQLGVSSGLLFGDSDRFLTDLAMNLDLRAALAELAAASGDIRSALRIVLRDLRPYQQRLGFVDAYGGPLYSGLNEPLAALNDPQLSAVLERFLDWRDPSVRHGVLPLLLDAVQAYCDR